MMQVPTAQLPCGMARSSAVACSRSPTPARRHHLRAVNKKPPLARAEVFYMVKFFYAANKSRPQHPYIRGAALLPRGGAGALAVAREPRPVQNFSFGSHAPADAGGAGYPVLQKVYTNVPQCARACTRVARQCIARVARLRLQPPGQISARSGQNNKRQVQ